MNLDEWMSYGVKKGWVTPAYCSTHEGYLTDYMDRETLAEFDKGGDPCVVVMMVIDK